MIGGFICGANLLIAIAVTRVREAGVEWRIDEQCVSLQIPGVVVFLDLPLLNSNGSDLGMRSKL